ncbi:hypothetical protein BBP40_007554 [Aspergillus hancockii]|nr:hypothetical protein BBP40_007554 [Aspergillus hancockii]
MDSVAPQTPTAFVRAVRKLYNPLGFKKGYNFTLFFIFGGAWMGFTLARLQFFDFPTFCKNVVPGECFYYKNLGYIGLYLHLGCILPAAFLVFFQFIPAIRYKFILFHRINGYIIILLILVSNAGALILARHTFGGLISTQAAVGFLVIMSTGALGIAYYNVKRLQLEQHRAWMLRAFFYNALVLGNFNGDVEQTGTALNLTFGMALWLALFLHTLGVEIYLQLTPRESQRLREISYSRQLEAGFSTPGRAGLTVDRFGDSETWVSEKLHE